MTARILLAMVHHSLQRASSGIANLSNKQHFMSIKYMDYKDEKMELVLDECINRIALCDDLPEKGYRSNTSDRADELNRSEGTSYALS